MCEEHSIRLEMYAMSVISMRYLLIGISWWFALYKITSSPIANISLEGGGVSHCIGSSASCGEPRNGYIIQISMSYLLPNLSVR